MTSSALQPAKKHPRIPDPSTPYDYIVSGLGCAGMSFLVRLLDSGKFADKKILAIDQSEKNSNDRTWCFWEKSPGPFESIVHQSWDHLRFFSEQVSREMDISPYRYKMIRGIEFYRYCLNRIKSAGNVEIRYGTVSRQQSDATGTSLYLDDEKMTAGFIFNSIPYPEETPDPGCHHLLQHFTGWVIETDEPVFDPACATLMDFRTDQRNGTAFVYVMPFTPHKALVEYTLFSAALLEASQYAAGIREYLALIGIMEYRIVETEFGVIPMTNRRFPKNSHHIYHLGSAGGETKPSSGYTFSFIQKRVQRLVRDLVLYGEPQPERKKRRFDFYDSVLLNVLATGKMTGAAVFGDLFARNRAEDIFAFLDNESSIRQDIAVIGSLPKMPFLRAAWQERRSLC